MTTIFMHYRKFDKLGQLEARGGLTLAVDMAGNQLTVALAECGKKDVFSKKMGRQIAEGRLRAAVASGDTSKLFILELPPETVAKSYIHNQSFVRERVQRLLAGAR
jgi:hypothetical protein